MIADIYELSPVQAGMLFHHVFAPDSTAYFDQFSCRLSGRVDPECLHRAWQQLVDRHPVFRTSFHWEGLDSPVQVVHKKATLPWEAHDWRGLPHDVQTTRWADLLDRDRARGFELGVPPLMRVAIVRVSDDAYRVCWSHHHLLLDGWCLTLVLTEVFTRYECLLAGRPPQLATVRPYGEYIKWLQQRDVEACQRFWRETLRGFDAPSQLPATVGPTVSEGHSQPDATTDLRLSTSLTDALRSLAARHRLTLSTLIQGAWAILVSRYTGNLDVVFGTTVSGRPPEVPGIETMLGVFINTVPVRVHVDGASCAAWLTDLQARHVERESFATIALSDIQKLSTVEPGTPLFESNVIVMNYRMDEGVASGAAGLAVQDVHVVDETDIPLTLQVTPGPQLEIEIVYDSARFERGAVARMLQHVEYLLAQFRDDLSRPLDAYEIVTPTERAELLELLRATTAPLETATTIVDLFERQTASTPDAIALECEGVRITFHELNAWANRLARGLAHSARLAPDTLVGLAFRRSEHMVAATLAVWKSGAAYVPIDPDYPDARVSQVFDVAQPLVVLRDSGTISDALEAAWADRTRFLSMDELDAVSRGESGENLDCRPQGADLAYVIFTSGSTGQPKGAMVEHVGMLNHMLAKVEDFHLGPTSVVAQNASHCFDISVWQNFAAMLAGGRTIVYRDERVLDPQEFLSQVRSDRVTVLEVVPSYLAAVLDWVEDDPRPLDDLQVLLVTGETVKPSLVERWFRLCPAVPLANAYGPTEASDDVTHAILREPPQTPTVPIGRPVRNFHIYIVDQHMRLCPTGVAGELCVSGPGVGRGYLNDPARTKAAFLEDPFRPEPGVRMYRTGDIGCFTDDGVLLLSGRKDHQVKVRGYRIELGDIEAALTGLDAVRDAAVVTRRDPTGEGVYLAAYASLHKTLTGAQILEQLASRLPAHMVPATCMVLPELPVTPNGKIDRGALPEPERGVRAVGTAYEAPRTSVEQMLVNVWRVALGVDRPGIHDNFFALGGDSILSMQIVSRASREGFALTPRDVFQHQTIAELSVVVRPGRARARSTVQPLGPSPLAPPQRHVFEDVAVDREHFNQSILLEVPPAFDAARCARAVEAVIAHHSALRLRYTGVDDVWQQSVADAAGPDVFTTDDVSALPPAEQVAAVDTAAARLQASLDLEHGPIFRVAFFARGAAESGRLLLIAHHLVMDGVSWRVLLEDLAAAYDDLGRGTAVSLPPVAASYLDWVAALTVRATSDEVTREVAYWTAPGRANVAPLPTDESPDAVLDTIASSADVSLVFDEAVTRGFLKSASNDRDAGPTDLLLAAVGLTFGGWTQQRHVLVDLEHHGRDSPSDDLDVTRTIGWFTSTFPVLLDLPESMTAVGDAMLRVREQMRRVPDRGSNYGPLRYLSAPDIADRLTAMPKAGILLNYHGRVDTAPGAEWRLSPDPHGAERSARQRREYHFDINGFVSDGRLRVTISYGRNVYATDTVQVLARHFEDHLVGLVGHLGSGEEQHATPSDYPAAHLDQASLNAVLAGTRDAEDIYELAPTQQGMLFHALYEPTAEAYFNQLTCTLRGELDVPAFQAAWQMVTARHAALRTSFHWRDLERPLQIVRTQVEIPWSVNDWSSLPQQEQQRRWRVHADDDRGRPFDLSTPPLMRCALSRTGPDTHLFRWSQHHLLLDGWSSAIVLNEVLAAYDARARGTRYQAPTPPRFRDNVVWVQQQDRAAAEQFWRQHLDGFTSATPLILGLPEMEGRTEPQRFGEAETRLPTDLSQRLRATAAAQQVTLNTLFLGVWAMVLSRQSGEADVVFGAIASGRPAALEGSDRMVGLFINTIPVRAQIDPDALTFAWLRDLQRTSADRDVYSYSSLADVQRWSQVEGGASLFETILIFENYPVATSLADGHHLLAVDQVQAFEPNNYPMTFVVTPGDSIALKIMFDEGRFDRATIDRVLGHVEVLLDQIDAEPERTLGALSIMSTQERALVDTWNRTERALPAGETVLSLIEARAQATPDRTAVTFEGTAMTYGALDRHATRLARSLRASGRVGPEARVVVLLRRSAQLPMTILALWKCGAVYVPVDPDYPTERITTIVTNATAALVIADRAELGVARTAAFEQLMPLVLLDQVSDAPPEQAARADVRCDPATLAYVIYTSGSTGAPKGAMLEQRGLLNHVLSMVDELELGPESLVAQTASNCFDISMWQLFAALVAGGSTAIYPDTLVQRPAALATQLESDGVTVAQFVPSYLNVFLDALEAARADRPSFDTLSHLVLIGEALKHGSVTRWFSLYPRVPLMNAYGPTEASDSVTHCDMHGPPRGTMVPIGRPIQNMAIYVVDSAMRLCPVGVKGEICIAGVGVGRGYLFDDARTTQVFVPDTISASSGRHLYRTGDLGCHAPDGTLLFFGRRDFQVKVRGHRIELGEVESCLAAIEGVRDAAVISREMGAGDTALVGYVTAKTASVLTAESLTDLLAERLPRYAVPEVIRVLPELPVMSNGKVDRRALAARDIDRPDVAPGTGASTETERALVRIWCEVLRHQDCGVDESFFDLGGHSLTAIQIVSRISRDFRVEIGIADLFERGTVRALAQLVDSSSTVGSIDLIAQPPEEHYDTSPMQQRMWLASRTAEGSAAYNMAGAFWLQGPVDVVALRRAFRALVLRHEALRTVFVLVGGSLRQQVRPADAVGDVLREVHWKGAPRDNDALKEAVRARIAAPFDLGSGPLFDVELTRVEDHRRLLLVRLHHIVGDAVSIGILLGEALALYTAFRQGDADPLPPLPIQYRDFVAWQHARAAAGVHQESRQYWLDALLPDLPRSGFTPDHPRRSQPSSRAVLIECELDGALSRRLRDLAVQHGTTLFSVVLSSVFAMLYRHSGQEDVVVGTTVSRRDHPLLERQVGCYLDTLALRGLARARDTAAALLDRTAHAWQEALAHKDYPFGSLLDDLRLDVPAGRPPLFDVLVDYVPGPGLATGLEAPAGLELSELTLDVEHAHHDTMFLIGGSDDGTTLSVRLVFNAELYTAETVASVRTRLLAILDWLALAGEATLGEVDLIQKRIGKSRRLHVNLRTD
jgi:amino acid adenylation domain-containing protein/non-ribosomal peptide synthase protein (TIGR01720 family)